MPEQGIKVRHGTYTLACRQILKRHCFRSARVGSGGVLLHSFSIPTPPEENGRGWKTDELDNGISRIAYSRLIGERARYFPDQGLRGSIGR